MASDPRRIQLSHDNNTVAIAYGAGISFGSGSAHCYLVIDGGNPVDDDFIRERGWETSRDSNGFVDWKLVHIPVDELRRISLVELDEGYYPGGSGTFKGSGRSLIKFAAARRIAANAVFTPTLWSRLRDHKVRRYEAELQLRAGQIRGGRNVPAHVYSVLKGRAIRLEEAEGPKGVWNTDTVEVLIQGRYFRPDNTRLGARIAAECFAACPNR